jgi:hypothetical protein
MQHIAGLAALAVSAVLAALPSAPQTLLRQPSNEAASKYLVVRVDRDKRPARPGATITLYADVTPQPKMHVYAPGQKDYIPIELATTAAPEFKAAPPKYPTPADFYYAPLRETVKVYDKPFRISQDVTLAATADLRRRAAAGETLTIAATLDYQACDDAVCYRPDALKLTWAIPLQRMP